MEELNYDKIQSELSRPQYLCLHCDKGMSVSAENRNHLVDSCKTRGSHSIWDKFPPKCGYAGWIFKERETQKHLVRQVKEEIHALSFLKEDTIVNSIGITAKELIRKLKAQIKPWEKHGSENW